MTELPSYEIPYPSSRQLTFDLGRIGLAKHHVRGLLEVDVTEPRRLIKQNRQAGRKISFTAWLIKAIADCVALHPPIAGVNDARRNKVLVFEDVDISIVVAAYRGAATIADCLASIDAATKGRRCEIIVVESSGDDTCNIVHERFPDVVVIRSDERLTAGGARNVGFNAAHSESWMRRSR